MRHIFVLIALLLSSVGMSLYAQPDYTPIFNAIQAGNANGLANYLDNSVEVTVLDNDDLYDRQGAIKKLSEFFGSNKPASCSVAHKGVSDNKTSHYAIASLAAGGKSFRVYVYMKSNGSQYSIQEIRIEKQ